MLSSLFVRFGRMAARSTGSPAAFLLAVGFVLGWLATGPIFGFSESWQMVINTGTTIITFLMVFLIQGSQNRDTEAMQLKLDELIRSTQGAHLALLDLEEMTEEELDRIRVQYVELARRSRDELRSGGADTGTPEVHPDPPPPGAAAR